MHFVVRNLVLVTSDHQLSDACPLRGKDAETIRKTRLN